MRTLTIIILVLVCTSLTTFYVSHANETAHESLTPPPAGSSRMSTISPPPLPYAGDSLIEEKIIDSDAIVRATMTGMDSGVYLNEGNEYEGRMYFSLDVSEYLKGTGPSVIVAEWIDGPSFESADEARDHMDYVLSDRDSRWDDREAIIFLYERQEGRGPDGNTFFLGAGSYWYYGEDGYSLRSEWNRRWLPSVAPGPNGGDLHGFLLDVPPAITMDDLVDHFWDVNHELESGDGSEEYRECVLAKYRHIRNERNWYAKRGFRYTLWSDTNRIASGQPAGTVVTEQPIYGEYPDTGFRPDIQVEDTSYSHEDLFYIDYGRPRPRDSDYDGQYDWVNYNGMVKTERPLPGGLGGYRFKIHERWGRFEACNFVITTDWYVYAHLPEDTIHEFFFDPIQDQDVVYADGGRVNGVLYPPYFENANDRFTEIQRLEWDHPYVRMTVTPDHDGLADHVLDIIELDGTVSLSLDISDATADASDMLVWDVDSQPWEDGDRLMVRVRHRLSTTLETNPTYHPCDTNRNGKIDKDEVIDVIRLYFEGFDS